MRRFLKVSSVFIILVSIFLFCGCSSLSVEKLRLSDFNVILPKGTQLIYEYDKTDAGGGGEGNSFYVNKVPEPESFISGISSSVQSKEEFILKFEKFLNYFNPKINSENLPNLNSGFLWAVKTHNVDERDTVLLVFSYDTQLIYVGIEQR